MRSGSAHGGRSFLALAVLATVVRALHAFSVDVPSNDGSHYLALAEELARGDVRSALQCVFHPGSAVLPAVLVRCGLDAFVAARLVAVLAGGTAAWLIATSAATWRAGPPAALAGLLFAGSFLGVRITGEAYSECTYLPLAALAVWSVLRERPFLAGVAIGAAFWVRPEALALLPLLFVTERPWRGALPAVLLAGSFPFLRWVLTGELALTPKLPFMVPMGPLGEGDFAAVLRQVGANLVQLPLDGSDALDWVGLPLGLFGLWELGRLRRRAAACWFVCLLIGWGAMVAFQVKPRFFLSQAPLLLPLLARALASRWLRVAAAAALAVSTFRLGLDLVHPPRAEMLAEKQLGQSLRAENLRPGDLITDLPRVAYYAGLHPPQPAVWTSENLRPLIAAGHARVVVLGALRAGRREMMEQLAEAWSPAPLPPPLGREAGRGQERLTIYRRR